MRELQNKTKESSVVDWAFFNAIPIEEVAEILGIEVTKNHFFLCPSHVDSKPSAQLRTKTNRWCCYACGDGKTKSVLDLVMEKENVNIYEAAKFLNQYYPGGIIEKIPEKKEKEELKPPFISNELLKEIGLDNNPYRIVNMKGIANLDGDNKVFTPLKKLQLAYEDATNLILDKLTEYQNSLKKYANDIFIKFPALDNHAKQYILKETQEKCDYIQGYVNIFRDYNIKLAQENEPSPWVEEERECV